MPELPPSLNVLGLLGLGSVFGALLTAAFAARRERYRARRAWLGDALASFYAPISTRLEVYYRWNEQLGREWRGRRKVVAGDPLGDVARKAVRANIEIREQVAAIIEGNLHHAESADLREAALAYLQESYRDRWHREVDRMGEALEDADSQILVPDAPEPRETFHQLVNNEFDRVSEEFRSLSASGRWLPWPRKSAKPRGDRVPKSVPK